jgi:magnesium-transporting ATPase (P-type)
MEFYNEIFRKKYFWWNLGAAAYSALVTYIFIVWGVYRYSTLSGFGANDIFPFIDVVSVAILFFFFVLFMVIATIKYRKVWNLAYPILCEHKNNMKSIIFAEYDKSGKIKYVLWICYTCVLVGHLLFFILAISCGWINGKTVLYSLCILLWLVVIIFPWVLGNPRGNRETGMLISSSDFLVYIHRQEKIKNGVKESKNHR